MAKKSVPIANAFGVLLRKERIAQRYSQNLLAQRARIHSSHIGLIERAERNPSLNVAQALAEALGFKLSDFIRAAENIVDPRKAD